MPWDLGRRRSRHDSPHVCSSSKTSRRSDVPISEVCPQQTRQFPGMSRKSNEHTANSADGHREPFRQGRDHRHQDGSERAHHVRQRRLPACPGIRKKNSSGSSIISSAIPTCHDVSSSCCGTPSREARRSSPTSSTCPRTAIITGCWRTSRRPSTPAAGSSAITRTAASLGPKRCRTIKPLYGLLLAEEGGRGKQDGMAASNSLLTRQLQANGQTYDQFIWSLIGTYEANA